MLLYDGTVDYYLDPDDYTKKADGTASDVANTSYGGNAMMEFPTIYFKRETDTENNTVTVRISNMQLDSDYHAYAHHDKNGNVLNNIYIACYDMGYSNSKGRSISGLVGYTGHTRAEEITAATACNTSGEIGEGWFTLHKADWDMIRDLAILISGTLDSQTAFGKGACSGGSSVKLTPGTLNDKGLFYGYSTENYAVKLFGIENFYGNFSLSLAGFVTDSSQNICTKMTYGTEDGSTSIGFNTDGTGYVTFPNTNLKSTTFIKRWYCGDHGFIPWDGSASSSTYTCDYYYSGSDGYASIGGRTDEGSNAGIMFIDVNHSKNANGWYCGTGLSYKGLASQQNS